MERAVAVMVGEEVKVVVRVVLVREAAERAAVMVGVKRVARALRVRGSGAAAVTVLIGQTEPRSDTADTEIASRLCWSE